MTEEQIDKIIQQRLTDKVISEFENEEWSKPYTDLDELFDDLGLND